MPLNLHVGPFGKSVTFADDFVNNLASCAMLQNLLNEMLELEKIIQSESNDIHEKKMAELLYNQLEEQLNYMIVHPGILNDEKRKKSPNKISAKNV